MWPSLLLIVGGLAILLAGVELGDDSYGFNPSMMYPLAYSPPSPPPTPPPMRLDVPYSIYYPLLAAFFNWRQQPITTDADPQSRSPPPGNCYIFTSAIL